MSEEYQRVEAIAGTARRRRRSTEQTLRNIEVSQEPGETVSAIARCNGAEAIPRGLLPVRGCASNVLHRRESRRVSFA